MKRVSILRANCIWKEWIYWGLTVYEKSPNILYLSESDKHALSHYGHG